MQCIVGALPTSQRYHTEFANIWRALVTFKGDAAVTSLHVQRIPTSLGIDVDGEALGPCEDVLGQLHHLTLTQYQQMRLARSVQGMASEAAHLSDAQACLQVLALDLDGPRLKWLGERELQYLRSFAEHGVRLRRLPSLHICGEPNNSTIQAIHTLIPPEKQSLHRLFCVEQVDILECATPEMIVAVLSSLEQSEFVEKVYLTMEQDPRDLLPEDRQTRDTLWRWVAYTLFNRSTRHKIQDVEIEMCHVDDSDVAQFREVIRSKNAVTSLFQLAPCEHHEFILASRFHTGHSSELRLFETSSSIVVRVIECPKESSEGMWRVILPGCGVAFVLQEDATELPGDENVRESFPVIRRLVLESVTSERKSTIEALLRALPCHIECLELVDLDCDDRIDDWYTPVMTACPGLKKLVMSRGFGADTLERFVDLATKGTSELEALDLSAQFQVHGNGLLQLLDTLADVHHPLAKHLRELKLAVTFDEPEGHDEAPGRHASKRERVAEFATTVCRMLDRNRRLYNIAFAFDAGDENLIRWPTAKVAIRTAPLAHRSKLALLSVLAHCASAKTPTAAGCLDGAVIAIIFQFAAEHRERQISTSTAFRPY